MYDSLPTKKITHNTKHYKMTSIEKTLDLTSKLSQKSVITYLKSVNWSNGSKSPFVVELDPTSQCNLACPDCISGELLNKDEIPTTRLLSLVDEIIDAGVKAVILIGGGEPMMHPAIGEVIRRLGEAKVKIGITTNGLFLKKYLEITAEYASWVRVSMDAGSSETFNKIRPSRTGKSLFDIAIKNMAEFAKLKKGKLGYSFMIYNEGDYGFRGIPIVAGALDKVAHIKTNVNEIFQAAQLAKDIGCDYFEIKPMYDINHFSVMQPENVSRIVDEQLIKSRTLNTDQFKVLEATKLWASLHGESNLEPKKYKSCISAESRTLITPSGVYVCPYFRGVEHKNLGKIQAMSFNELWHGPVRREVIKNLDPSKDCPMQCIRHDSHLILNNWINGGYPLPNEDFDLFI
jgi:MoaA/NifB/PqqE/SkfB family radical SAM enzyme